jgi:type VI protein secretion system component VasK
MIERSRPLEGDVSFWELFFILLIFIPLLMLWIFALADLFRRHDLSGWAKALWAIAIVLLPLLGMLIYFLTRPSDEEEQEQARRAAEQEQAVNVTQQLGDLAKLQKKGVITEDEFQQQKAKLLGS